MTTTSATLPDGDVMEELHERLAEKKVLPSQHLVDKGYVDAELIAASVNTSIRLISLAQFFPIPHGHQKKLDVLITATFSLIGRQKVFSARLRKQVEIGVISLIDTENRVARIRFPLPLCRACSLHPQCTQTSAKVLILRPDEQTYNALQQARQRA